MTDHANDDSLDLARAGYRQELDRSLGSFSAFAAGFSYLSILTGIFQNFHTGFGAGGPAFFWTWPLMFFGQLTVALCFAELAAHYPLCGGVYPWARRIGSPFVGWMTGWIYLSSLVVTLAAVALALQITLPQVWPAAQFVDTGDTDVDTARNAVILGAILIAFSTFINSVGVRWLARINNLGVFAELFGALLLIVLLAIHTVRGPAVLFDTQGRGANHASGYFGAFCAAAVMASYVMYGYDTAGTLAEETANPRRRAPRAIWQALTAAAVGGGLLLLFALLSAPDLSAASLAEPNGGLPRLVTDVLGRPLGMVFLIDVLFAITVCTLAVHGGTVRLMFALARDRMLPMSNRLSRVSPTTKTPTTAVLLSGGLALVLLLANINFADVIDLLVRVSIVWANLAYLFVTFPLLLRRLNGWPARNGSGVNGIFSLGRWSIPINVVAVAWGLLTAVNIAWPRSSDDTAPWYTTYAAPLYTAVLLAVGIGYYAIRHRRRAELLPVVPVSDTQGRFRAEAEEALKGEA
jgi:urea carboxylase system permease